MNRCFRLSMLAIVSLLGTTAFAQEPHFGYEGPHGPEHWGNVSKWQTCKTGTEQSPIDIVAASAKRASLPALKFSWTKSKGTIVNNGHTIQVNLAPGSSLTVGGKTYQLKQFHFHTPSEHTVGGDASAMEVHFVHEAADKKLGVVGILMKESNGANPHLAAVMGSMPKEKGEGGSPTLDIIKILPASRAYYSYPGSL